MTQSFELTVTSGAGPIEVPSAGNHPSRLVGLLNGGTHMPPAVAGVAGTPTLKYMLIFELPHEIRADGRPFVVLYECTASLHTKATLRKLADSLLGRQLRDGERFLVTELLGKPCSVAIVHESKDERAYAKISSIGPPIKGITLPAQHYPTVIYSILDGAPFPALDFVPFHFGRSVADWLAESEEAQRAMKTPIASTPPSASSPVVDGGNIVY
jgi:hypothetical protein